MPQPNVEQTSARSHQRVPPTYTPQLTIRGTWPPTYTPLGLNLLVSFPNSSGLGNLTTHLNTLITSNLAKLMPQILKKDCSIGPRILQYKMLQSQRSRKVKETLRKIWRKDASRNRGGKMSHTLDTVEKSQSG